MGLGFRGSRRVGLGICKEMLDLDPTTPSGSCVLQ